MSTKNVITLKFGIRLLYLFLCFAPSAVAQERVDSDFNNEKETWKIWCEAQIDIKNGPATFSRHNQNQPNSVDKFISIAAIEESLGGNKYDGNKCLAYAFLKQAKPSLDIKTNQPDDEQADELGPPVFEPTPQATMLRDNQSPTKFDRRNLVCPGTVWDLDSPSSKPYCTSEKVKYAKSRVGKGGEKMHPVRPVCMQRQEVRYHPQNTNAHHFYSDSRTYRIRFKLPTEEQICDRIHGLRWVNAQWKLKPAANGARSPFLAKRFDNGFLFITVQAKNCRCIVAAAAELESKFEQIEGRPLFCQWTGDEAKDPACTIENVNLQVSYGQKKWLDNTLGRWSQMTFEVKPHLKLGLVKIWQDDTLISTISGTIGYEPKDGTSRVKFKFGQYRDYQPREHEIQFDWIDLSATAKR